MSDAETQEFLDDEEEELEADFSSALQSLGDHLKESGQEYGEETDEFIIEENPAGEEAEEDVVFSFSEEESDMELPAAEEPIVSFGDEPAAGPEPEMPEQEPEPDYSQLQPPAVQEDLGNGGLDLTRLTQLLEELKTECLRVAEMRKSVAKAREMIRELSQSLES